MLGLLLFFLPSFLAHGLRCFSLGSLVEARGLPDKARDVYLIELVLFGDRSVRLHLGASSPTDRQRWLDALVPPKVRFFILSTMRC